MHGSSCAQVFQANCQPWKSPEPRSDFMMDRWEIADQNGRFSSTPPWWLVLSRVPSWRVFCEPGIRQPPKKGNMFKFQICEKMGDFKWLSTASFFPASSHQALNLVDTIVQCLFLTLLGVGLGGQWDFMHIQLLETQTCRKKTLATCEEASNGLVATGSRPWAKWRSCGCPPRSRHSGLHLSVCGPSAKYAVWSSSSVAPLLWSWWWSLSLSFVIVDVVVVAAATIAVPAFVVHDRIWTYRVFQIQGPCLGLVWFGSTSPLEPPLNPLSTKTPLILCEPIWIMFAPPLEVLCNKSPHFSITFRTAPRKIAMFDTVWLPEGSFRHVVLQVFGLVLSTLSVALLFEKVFRSEALGRYCNTLGEAPTSALIVFLRLGAKSRAVG